MRDNHITALYITYVCIFLLCVLVGGGVEMSDLISKSSLIYKLQHWREKLIQEYGENDEYVRCLDGVLDVYISDAPTVDAVEVVRCEKCKHSYETILGSGCEPLCGLVCTKGVCVDCIVPEDFCCPYGERKEAAE